MTAAATELFRVPMSYLNAALDNSRQKRKFHLLELEQAVNTSQSSLAGKRVLALDDEFLIALDIQQILESAGAASVACAANAADALQAINAAHTFDVAVLDLKLAGSTSSLHVADALVEAGIPFVFLTGMQGDSALRKYPKAPVVEKPYDTDLLIEAVLSALGGRYPNEETPGPRCGPGEMSNPG